MYEINGTPMLLHPESGHWLGREQVGVDGQSRPIYEPTYKFRIAWGPMSWLQFNQIYQWWENIHVTGTVSIVLPGKTAVIYTGTLYTGVLLEEPTTDITWTETQLRPTMVVRNIVV